MDLLLYLPNAAEAGTRVPGLNFIGNQAIARDPGIADYAAMDGRRPEAGVSDTGRRRVARAGRPLAGRDDPGSRLRPGHRLLRRHRARLPDG